MATIDILYSPYSYDNMMRSVLFSEKYTDAEKTVLGKMLRQMKDEQFLLYMVDIYQPETFCFEIPEYDKFKTHIQREVYLELTEQLLRKCADYEEIGYNELRRWFYGMTMNIELLTYLDKRFKEKDIRILY